MRDVLGLGSKNAAHEAAAEDVQRSRWVELLRSSQRPDGTWGRFHSQDTTIKQRFPTTESAINAALDCGLDAQSPILARLLPALIDYVEGRSLWPDRPEKHDNPLAWPIWVRHFSAANLALIDDRHPVLEGFWQLWAEVLEAAFGAGEYDRQREIAALNRLLDCRMKNPVPFHVWHPLLILSATSNRLPAELERAMLEHLLDSPAGIYYVCEGAISALPEIGSKPFYSWLHAHRLLSRFDLWKDVCADAVNWIWGQRTADGLWDLGRRVARKPYTCFPLSESWRRQENRIIDSTVEVLCLLSRSL
jgi:hypothetical protein